MATGKKLREKGGFKTRVEKLQLLIKLTTPGTTATQQSSYKV